MRRLRTEIKFVVESAIFNMDDPDLPIHYATFMESTMMIKGSLLLSIPTVKRCIRRRKDSGQKLMVWRINKG